MSRHRTEMVSVRLNPTELDVLRLRAAAAKKTLSALLRDAALDGVGQRCQHEDCAAPAGNYWRLGRTVGNGPFNYCSGGEVPEFFRLCPKHALRVLGVSFQAVAS